MRALGMTMAAVCSLVIGCTDTKLPGAGAGGAGAAAGVNTELTGGVAADAMADAIAGATGGVMAGTAGGGTGELCVNTGADDATCPDGVGPFTGPCAPKGTCCHRSSNTTKIAALGPDEDAVLEYRVTRSAMLNHPRSRPLILFLPSGAAGAKRCAGEECLLWRFQVPRRDGMIAHGPGKSTISVGRYNCDGTYSYYDDTVAFDRSQNGLSAPDRWNAVAADTIVDPPMMGAARIKIEWASNPNQRLACSPFFLPNTMPAMIDWELCSSGTEILELDTTTAGEDCQGEWTDFDWVTPGLYQTFVPLADNDLDIIDEVGQSFAQLLSFSILQPDDKMRDPNTLPRCMPDEPQPTDPSERMCKWIKLPDSLCPVSDEERAIFRCHLGAEDNPNASQEEQAGYPADLNCTAQAPSMALDPDVNPAVSKGQCCDPLGMGTNGLPACNAFRIVNRYAAAAAEITEDKSGELPPVCM